LHEAPVHVTGDVETVVPDFHEAVGEDMVEETANELDRRVCDLFTVLGGEVSVQGEG